VPNSLEDGKRIARFEEYRPGGRKRERVGSQPDFPSWVYESDSLMLGEKGSPRPTFRNAVIALQQAPEMAGVLYYDIFHNRPVLKGRAPWMAAPVTEQPWTEADDLRTTNWLQEQGIAVAPNVVGQAVELVALDREFHPVRDYLNACRWDGEPRLDLWITHYLGSEDTDYVRCRLEIPDFCRGARHAAGMQGRLRANPGRLTGTA
jgi:predicted P-loop ATPase